MKNMSDMEIPDAEELQRRLRTMFQTAFQQKEEDAQETDLSADEAHADAAMDIVEKFSLTPREIKAHLDRFVIKQDEAKKVLSVAVCDHYNHAKFLRERERRGETSAVEYAKQNVLVIGPTGVGKTYLVHHIAELIGVPFVKADATKFSETGYVGGDVEDLVRELVQKADGDIALAEHGIIYIDEVDKIASSGGSMGRDVSGRGVQTTLLKLMEETEVPMRSPMDFAGQMQAMMAMQRGGKPEPRTINTRSILFVVSGAFSKLKDIVEKRRDHARIGFGAPVPGEVEETPWQHEVTTADLVEYGMEAEFVGRLPVRVACDELTAEDLRRVLTESEGSILRQYERSFSAFGIEAVFEDEAIDSIATLAAKEKTGARGLLTVCDRVLRDFKFELPGSGVSSLRVNDELIERPEERLSKLLEAGCDERDRALRLAAQEFASKYEQTQSVSVVFAEDALDLLVGMAKERRQPMRELCAELFKDYEFGLRLLKRQPDRGAMILPREAVLHPDKFLSEQVVRAYRSYSTDETTSETAS